MTVAEGLAMDTARKPPRSPIGRCGPSLGENPEADRKLLTELVDFDSNDEVIAPAAWKE